MLAKKSKTFLTSGRKKGSKSTCLAVTSLTIFVKLRLDVKYVESAAEVSASIDKTEGAP